MDAKKKYEILTEGQKEGVSLTCRTYGISRTLYYRWLSRYKANGMKGLQTGRMAKAPANLTDEETSDQVLGLIRSYPSYGPREICYLLEDYGKKISESCVYNIMRRHGLSTREKRLRFAKKKSGPLLFSLPPLHSLKSGECLLFFLTPCASHKETGMVYAYTLMDYKSRIACTRLYTELSVSCFIDLLTAAAVPVAHSLDLRPKYLCFSEGKALYEKNRHDFSSGIHEILQSSGFDMTLFFLEEDDLLNSDFKTLKNEYYRVCLASMMPLFLSDEPLDQIKLHLQRRIRSYNIQLKISYEGLVMSPTEYHSHVTGSSRILPLWAYIDRIY
ncbi:helix-turn-helix domain-containing protein [Proteiniclasticum sp. C24MP]|uniref:helix-turn-helix domain-containing protein n=1 Tax=Proteiniclasticum sp. C24MP TaxID=3374101 RepID=UPI00375420F8